MLPVLRLGRRPLAMLAASACFSFLAVVVPTWTPVAGAAGEVGLLSIAARARAPGYKLPYPSGLSFDVCQGNNTDSTHSGVAAYAWDFCMPVGTPVTAARGGVVRAVRQDSTMFGWGPEFAADGNYVIVDHGDGTSALYLHLRVHGAAVQVGQTVTTGEILGYSGNTGWSSGPHLHFMVMRTDPASWYSQSIPASFLDVTSNEGVPLQGRHYHSGPLPLSMATASPPVLEVERPEGGPQSIVTPAPPPPPNSATITITDQGFTPADVWIARGGSVLWVNHGVRVHTVSFPNGGFQSAGLNPGDQASATFGSAGSLFYSSGTDCLDGNRNPGFRCQMTYVVKVIAGS